MSVENSFFEMLETQLPGLNYKRNEPMKNHTSFKIGGTVNAVFIPQSVRELVELRTFLLSRGIMPFIIGNGTNLLVENRALGIYVIKTTGLSNIELTGETELKAESGVLLSRLSSFACENGLSGLEFAHGIPGTLGGAITMNAGAYGGQMCDVIAQTYAYGDGGEYMVTGAGHMFGYRKSCFSQSDGIILNSVLKLEKGTQDKIKARMEEFSKRRRESQPLNYPSAGSTFKRPKDGYAAEMIEKAGLKGYTVGGACVSEKHSGFIINRDNASFSDVIAVIEHVREEVYKKFGTELELEVKILRTKENGVVWS